MNRPRHYINELLDVLYEQHSVAEIGTCKTFPAVFDRVDLDEQILRAFTARFDGAYIDCSPDDETLITAAGPVNEPLFNVVRELCGSRNVDIALEQSGDRIQISSPRYATPTGGSGTILNVLTAVVSHDVNSPLTLLTYARNSLDEEQISLLRDVCNLVAAYPLPGLRTFVPIAVGPLKIADDLNPPGDQSARIVLQWEALTVRQSREWSVDKIRSEILRSRDQAIVLFLGAGASASARIPMGNTVRDWALRSMTGADAPEAIEKFRARLALHGRWLHDDERQLSYEDFAERLTLERVLLEEFHQLQGDARALAPTIRRLKAKTDEAKQRLPKGRRALRDLAAELPNLIIATVNFDELIEDGMPVPHVVAKSEADFIAIEPQIRQRLRGETTDLPILKVHGSIDDAETIIADIRATEAGLPRGTKDTLQAIVDAAKNITWVWVGCSMRDLDIEGWLKSPGVGEMKEYWVDPLPPRSVARYAEERREEMWKRERTGSLKDRQITETSDVFFEELLRHARTLPPVSGGTATTAR